MVLASLSEPRSYIAAAIVGNKIFFAGGAKGINDNLTSNTIDIYNISTNTWSIAQLSQARGGISAGTVNNKIYFAGGWTGYDFDHFIPSNRIDIYDNISNTWKTSSLSELQGNVAGITVADKIYWAKGCKVESKDINAGSTSISYLSRPGDWIIDNGQNTIIKDNKIVFFKSSDGGDQLDIYDIATDSWSIGILPQHILMGASIISVNNTIYVAGGSEWINGGWIWNKQVRKLEF